MPNTESWIVQSRMSLREHDPERFRVHDTIECARKGASFLTIKRGKETCLDVKLIGTEETLSFERKSHRGGHGDSERFRGEVRHITLGNVAVLVGVLGYREDASGTGDDDDTEVVVATKPATS